MVNLKGHGPNNKGKMGSEKYIFISYAREDAEFALRLANDLRNFGIAIWIDQLDIPTGARWDDAIQQALHHCANLLIVLSPASVSSENVKDEIGFALHKNKPIVPVLYKECEIPFRLLRFNYVDFTKEQARGLDILLTNLRKAGFAEAVVTGERTKDVILEAPIFTPATTVPPEMVLIPAGSFLMGSDDGETNERPVHRVHLDTFYLDKYQVTVAKFKAFAEATGYKTDAEKEGWSYAWTGKRWEKKERIFWRRNAKGEIIEPEEMDHPVIHVSWNDANTYAQWAGKRLPTEAEWEYAARCGKKGYKYSWGDGVPAGKTGGNIADESLKRVFKDWEIWDGFDDGFVFTAPVGAFEPNEFGLYDMTGNVWEWCQDWYDGNYYKDSPARNPVGPTKGSLRVLRGSSWYSNPSLVRCAMREGDNSVYRSSYIGFRCAQDFR